MASFELPPLVTVWQEQADREASRNENRLRQSGEFQAFKEKLRREIAIETGIIERWYAIDIFKWVIIIARFALISHLIEAIIIAGFSAKSQGDFPPRSAVYIFFVGTVGLLSVRDRTNSPFFKQI